MAADLAFLTRLHGPQHDAVPCTKPRYRSRTEEARGSNPLTSTPKPAGQGVASFESAALTACCGRAAAATSSHSAAQRLSEANRPRPRPHTMTTQRGHHQLPPDGRSSCASSLSRSAWPVANHRPRRRPSPKSTLRWPSTACASFERQAPTSGRRRAVMNMAGDHADPGHPKPYGCRPPPHPATSLPVGHRDAQTPDAGHWTPGRSDARTGHRSPGQAPVGHRTLAADTGHRMPDTNADTVTTPQPASGPPWPPCRATAR
jgi:hypothetical protein